jgi:hypothetical protein
LTIPVVMLAINTSALSSIFLTLFNFIHHLHGLSSLEHLLVIYLSGIVMTTIQIITTDSLLFSRLVKPDNITIVIQVVFSLIINIYATSIIALKAWCVRVHGIFGNHFVD